MRHDTRIRGRGRSHLYSCHLFSSASWDSLRSFPSIYCLTSYQAKRRDSAKEGMIQTIVSHNIHSRVERGAKKTKTFEGEGKRGQLLCCWIVKRDEHKLKRSKINVELKWKEEWARCSEVVKGNIQQTGLLKMSVCICVCHLSRLVRCEMMKCVSESKRRVSICFWSISFVLCPGLKHPFHLPLTLSTLRPKLNFRSTQVK